MNSAINGKLDALRRRNVPLAATLEVTKRCNGRCAYCYATPGAGRPELDTSAMLTAVDKLCDAGVLAMTITGGEPFLRGDILDILDRCIRRECFRITVLSNATALKREHIDYLVRNRRYLTHFRASGFSHRSAIHDRYLGVPGAFDAMLAACEELHGAGIHVTIAVNAMDFNVDELGDTLAFFRLRGLDVGLGLRKQCTPACGPERMSALVSEEFYLRAFRSLGNGNQWARELEKQRRMGEDSGLCLAVAKGIAVNASGDISPCIGYQDAVVGSILDPRPLRDILALSAEYRRLRYASRHDLACGQCDLSPICAPCVAVMDRKPGSLGEPNAFSCNLARAIRRFAGEDGTA